MRRPLARVLLAALLAVAALARLGPAQADRGGGRREGSLGGVAYSLARPPDWNGTLVMWAHGYGSNRPQPPLASHLEGHGYAWAGSLFRSIDYRPDWFIEDTLALRELFIREVGAPRRTIIYGQSMGGHIAIASLELHPEIYHGALIECGNVTGIGEADFLYAYRAAADYFSGLGLLDIEDKTTFWRAVNERWLPAMGTPGRYTVKGRRFDSVVKYLTGGELPLRLQGLEPRYLKNLGVTPSHAASRMPMERAGSTLHVRYRIDRGLGVDEAELNAKIRRRAPIAGARSRDADPVFADFTGRIRVPVLTLHETGDGWVPFSLEQDLRRKTLAAGTAHLLVQRAHRWPGHCAFDQEVREQAFDDLVRWMDTGVRPDGDDVLAADRSTLGLRWTPTLHVDDPARRRTR
ncbi:MAG: hypothetical protein HY294_12410 [Candidatus Rokubacteria bacterium]|nr:hypothetical protein [Candidatus Rokubacteria bacterium]